MGVVAADALGETKLAHTMREAVALLNSLSTKRDAAVYGALGTKVTEAHHRYEALRTKLFKLF